MIDTTTPSLLLTSQARQVGASRSLQRRAERGELARVRVGAYVDARTWASLSADARYRLTVHAAAASLHNDTQFSHQSAAALWHLPNLGRWPSSVHVLSSPTSGGRSSGGVVRHGVGLDPNPVMINNSTATSLARTVSEIARVSSFSSAVCVADAALAPPEVGSFRALNLIPPMTLSDLRRAFEASESPYGFAKFDRVAAFASGKSGSPGESVSRVQFHLMGFPPPTLQVPFFDAQGFIGYADFYWPELDLIGEFDGVVKYLGKRYRRGRLPEQVVLDEKLREDRMRAVVRAFVRWDWSTAMDQRLLAARVRPHGLLPVR